MNDLEKKINYRLNSDQWSNVISKNVFEIQKKRQVDRNFLMKFSFATLVFVLISMVSINIYFDSSVISDRDLQLAEISDEINNFENEKIDQIIIESIANNDF